MKNSMLNMLKLVTVAIFVHFCSGSAMAFETNIPLRTFENKLDTDDLVMLERTGLGPHNVEWLVFQDREAIITMINHTVAFTREVLHKGVLSFFKFPSFDYLHGLTLNTDRTDLYDMKVYFTPDFIWIEVTVSDEGEVGGFPWPVSNTVYFTGPSESTYRKYFNKNTVPGEGEVFFGNYAELKKDVQTNYASKYNVADPGFIQYKRDSKGREFNPDHHE